jgi:hypothetical protein
MKRQWYKGWQVIVGLLAAASLSAAQTGFATPAQAQPPAMPPPGAVNYIEGQVSVDGQSLAQATRPTVLQPNQTINTGQGYAEVLLTPGTFLRIGPNSEARLITAGLADTKIALTRGSAMIEADQVVKGANIAVVINGATTQIEEHGLYDFDANQQTVKVLDGKAKVFEANRSTTLKKADEVLLASQKPLKKHDFSVQTAENDPLYVWSNVRSQQEAAANVNLAQSVAANGGWYGPGWYWDPYWNFWAFMPGWGALYSPFGWGFYSPGFIWAAPGYYGHFGYGHFGYGRFGHGYVARGYAHPGMSGFHAAGGFHGAFGGFHGGGGHR